MLLRLSARVLHTRCSYDAKASAAAIEEAEYLQRRAAHWETVCDPAYLRSEDWIQAGGGPGLNMRAVNEALALRLDGEKPGAFLFGAVSGTGKTTSAWILLKRLHMRGAVCVKVTHIDLYARAAELSVRATPGLARWHKLLRTCDALFIDDLGKARSSTFTGDSRRGEELLYDILDYRVSHRLHCIYTANVARAELRGIWSPDRADPILRRLRESCAGVNFDAR